MVMPSSCPATTRFSLDSFIWGSVGFTTSSPSIRPMRTAPTGPFQGMPEMESAAEAPLMPKTLGG